MIRALVKNYLLITSQKTKFLYSSCLVQDDAYFSLSSSIQETHLLIYENNYN